MEKDNLDLKIRKAMVYMSEDVQPSDDMFERIKSQIEFEQSRKEKVVTMKRNRKLLKSRISSLCVNDNNCRSICRWKSSRIFWKFIKSCINTKKYLQ